MKTLHEQIKKMRESGKTYREIGEVVKRSRQRIHQLCKKNGIELKIEKRYGERPTHNTISVNGEGMVIIGEKYKNHWGKNFVEITNESLRQAIREIYHLEAWIEPISFERG